jgi:lysozyme family protein
MLTIQDIAQEIVAREGGYVNDPDDPGGATKYGVTIHTMRALGRDLNHDGRIDPADVRLLDKAEAVEIFLTRYFDRPGLGTLPPALQPSVFDMYVNAGVMAVKLLQRVLKARGHQVTDDGLLGPRTLSATRAEMAKGATAFTDAYAVARRDFYYALADARPASRKYARRKDGGKGGWITRAEEFMSPALHLSPDQHRARIAQWH